MAERRRVCSPLARSKAARALAERLEGFAPLQAAAVVAGYVPVRGEIDPRPALEALAAQGVVIVWPRVGRGKPRLAFFRVSGADDWGHGPFGILEPKPGCPEVPVAAIDAFVTPGLAFDPRGYRLGWGGGYYDELIAGLPVRQRVLLLGVAHDFQVVSRCPHESFDAPIDWIVTDRQTIACQALRQSSPT